MSALLALRITHVWLVLGLTFALAWDGTIANDCGRRLSGGVFLATVLAGWPLVALAIVVDTHPACFYENKVRGK